MSASRVPYETARLKLARYRVEGEASRARAAEHATRVSAEALDVERVGLWLFRDRGARLLCASQYARSEQRHSSGQVLLATQYPTYVRALQERRAIAATDARTHELTRELTDSYLVPNGITSMLDAPIIRGGKVVGVVCHEHTGEPREWTPKELSFASSVADMVTLVFEYADRMELEAALQTQAEERLQHEKMEALGRLAATVAHDFNNLLATIQLTLGLLVRSVPATLKSHVDELQAAIDVSRRLTQQLLTFGRHSDDGGKQAVNLRELLARMEPVVRAALGRSIKLSIDVQAAEARVLGDPSQLEQVVLNLGLNARDAIAREGEIAIAVRDPQPEDEVSPDMLVLEVRDTGEGMSESTCERIFEPFFTTKERGTGLGLPTVYGIVRRSGGSVRARSAPGSGTRMLVALPRAPMA